MMSYSAAVGSASAQGRARGFSLVELMSVVAVMAILAVIAYPAYQTHITKSRRADAKAVLLDASARMERFYFDQNTYTSDLTDLGYAADPASSPEQYWTLSAAAGPTGDIATSYALTATPAAGFSDAQCTTLTLNSRGQKGSTGSATTGTCWR
jgi:type IV pilus assembly protein PilE